MKKRGEGIKLDDCNTAEGDSGNRIDSNIASQQVVFDHEESILDKKLQHQKDMEDKKHTHEKEMLTARLGWLGSCFGDKEILPLNISGGLIFILLIFAGTITTIVFYKGLSINIKDVWSVVTPIITLALGYLFGSKKDN